MTAQRERKVTACREPDNGYAVGAVAVFVRKRAHDSDGALSVQQFNGMMIRRDPVFQHKTGIAERIEHFYYVRSFVPFGSETVRASGYNDNGSFGSFDRKFFKTRFFLLEIGVEKRCVVFPKFYHKRFLRIFNLYGIIVAHFNPRFK